MAEDLLAALQASVDRARSFQKDLSADLDQFGGFLRCETCGLCQALEAGDAGFYTRRGWPRHCGLTMRWWTQKQIDAGEVEDWPERYTRDAVGGDS